MPINYSDYPKTWKTDIHAAIVARSGNHCELCFAKNGAHGYRAKNGDWYSSGVIHFVLHEFGVDLFDSDEPLAHCFDKRGNPTRPTKIVLTKAHWDNPEKMDCRLENLRHACQRCHLLRDLPHHMEKARLTRERKAGMQRLF